MLGLIVFTYVIEESISLLCKIYELEMCCVRGKSK